MLEEGDEVAGELVAVVELEPRVGRAGSLFHLVDLEVARNRRISSRRRVDVLLGEKTLGVDLRGHAACPAVVCQDSSPA